MTEPKAETHTNTSLLLGYATDKPNDNENDRQTDKKHPTVKGKISEVKVQSLI